ncbi:MAG TPA: hypothetical protein VLG49_01750 [Rhabdochlamydiaceae bacterium]|nr:hypothetical protein [Rhabdochlamydiaceae bacterium]
MTYSMKLDPKTQSCSLLIYCFDKRISEMKQDAMTIAFSRQTAAKLNDVVSARFGITEETDRKLFESIFYDKEYDHFTFQHHNPNNTYQISIYGDQNAILKEDNPEFSMNLLNDPNRAVGIKKYETKGVLRIKQEKTYTGDQIEHILYGDYPVVSLFNSHSFKRLTEYNPSLYRGRVLEKLTPSKL